MTDHTPPPVPGPIRPGQSPTGLTAAVDVGGTTLKAATVAPDGTLGPVVVVDTPREPEASVAAVAALTARVQREAAGQVVAFGVCTPGIVDGPAGIVRDAPNLGWGEVALRDRLREATGLDGAIAHDMRAAGLAEWRLGGARGLSDFCFIALGTGISAALVVDGHLLQARGYAGEIGHAPVPAADGVPCACGALGCLETVASAAGVRRTAARLRGIAVADELPTHELAGRARSGDGPAVEAFALAARALAESFTVLVTALGPERIVVGGGMAGALDLLCGPIEAALTALPFQRRTTLRTARLGPQAGLIGAGLTGAEHVGLVAPVHPGAGGPRLMDEGGELT